MQHYWRPPGKVGCNIRIAYLSHVYPSITQTFTVNEVHWWRKSGLDVDVISFRRPRPSQRPALAPRTIGENAQTYYLRDVPITCWLKGVWVGLKSPRVLAKTLWLVLTEAYLRETTLRKRAAGLVAWLRSFGVVGFVVARNYQHIHADFADETATVAWVVHLLTGADFSLRSHTSFNPQLLKQKLEQSVLVLAISEYDRRCLVEVGGQRIREKVVVNHLGVDIAGWSPAESPTDVSSGQIVCVGTLQEKKGHRYLIEACAILQQEAVSFRCLLIGDGPLRGELERTIAAAHLRDRFLLLGYLPNSEVKRLAGEAAVICAPSVTASNGDIDGIPYVLMEAMALGRPCVATYVSGVPELITHEVSGLLVPERDPAALAATLKRLLLDQGLRRRLGRAARQEVLEKFDGERNAHAAVALLKQIRGAEAREGNQAR